jgi:hypothetical protein
MRNTPANELRLWSERSETAALPHNWIVQTIAPGLSATLPLPDYVRVARDSPKESSVTILGSISR